MKSNNPENMVTNKNETWKDVWERKGKEAQGLTLEDLIKADGFDKGLGRMSTEAWMALVHLVATELALSKRDSLLEVGCGSGALLLPLSQFAGKVAGIDFSSTLVKLAQQAIPGADIKVAEAARIPFEDAVFSKVVVNSVFQYFPDYKYAEKALDEMRRVSKPGARILVMDIPDIVTKQDSEAARNRVAGTQPASPSNDSLTHLYYPRSLFLDFGETRNLTIKLFTQHKASHAQSKFRFNALITDE